MGTETLANLEPWSLSISQDTGTVTVTASGSYKPSLVKVLGIDSFGIGAQATATWGIGKVEVALALDNTGSMSGEKIVKLKEGAQKLLDILKAAARKEGDAKVAVVPYTVQVKVDPAAFAIATWWRDGYCSKSQHKTQITCQNNNGTWRQTNSISWTGCIADRDQKNLLNNWINHDVNDTEPFIANNDTKFPRAPWNSGDCPAATILPLTDVYTGYNTIKNKINEMQAVGNTNVTVGAAWGWHVLDNKAPFAEGQPYNTKNLQKYLILMTDGDNTENRFSSNSGSIDNRTEAVCDNIKALPKNTANDPPTTAIKVWTIRVVNGNANLLRDCATNTSMYINVTDPAQLESEFAKIGTEIANLHLSK
jgi:hypothetical protein